MLFCYTKLYFALTHKDNELDFSHKTNLDFSTDEGTQKPNKACMLDSIGKLFDQ